MLFVSGSDGSSIPPHSPWGTTPSPRPTPWQPSPPHRVKAVPTRLTKPHPDLTFAMKPPQGVRNYRKKMRNYKRRCRQPDKEIKIGLFVLRLECQSAAPRLKRRPRPVITPAARNRRLDDVAANIVTRKSQIHVPIAAWRTGRTDLQNLIKNPPSNPPSPAGPPPARPTPQHQQPPGSPRHNMGMGHAIKGLQAQTPGSPRSHHGGGPLKGYPPLGSPGPMRIKSELKMVTETCTAAVPSPPRHSVKVRY